MEKKRLIYNIVAPIFGCVMFIAVWFAVAAAIGKSIILRRELLSRRPEDARTYSPQLYYRVFSRMHSFFLLDKIRIFQESICSSDRHRTCPTDDLGDPARTDMV